MDQKLKERIESKILGLEIAIEAEDLVVVGMQPYRIEFDSIERPLTPELLRRMRQLLDSEKSIAEWKQEVSDLRTLLSFYEENNK